MFGKEPETNQVQPQDPRATSILAQGCKFKGEVDIQGTFRVEGEFEGVIRNPDTLVVGKTGLVKADCHVKNAVIGGTLQGNINAEDRIELQSGSVLEGDIRTRRLVIDEGVVFEGNCSMGKRQKGEEPGRPLRPQEEAPADKKRIASS